MRALKCIIVDDNEVELLMAKYMVSTCDFLEVVAAVKNAEEALPFLEKGLDVAFLDIDLDGMSGIELRKLFMDIPACVFISSHLEFALESFELDALDFISKPLKRERFDRTLQKLRDYFDMREKSGFYDMIVGQQKINIKQGHDVVQVNITDIKYLEALKDYTRIITPDRRFCVLKSIGLLLKEEGFDNFVRIHRSYAIPKNLVTKKASQEVVLDNFWKLPIGRAYKANLDFFDL